MNERGGCGCLGVLALFLVFWFFPSDYGPSTLFNRDMWMPFYGTMVIYPRTPLWSNVIFFTYVGLAVAFMIAAAFPPEDQKVRERELFFAFASPFTLTPLITKLRPDEFLFWAAVVGVFLLYGFVQMIRGLRQLRRLSRKRAAMVSSLAVLAFGWIVFVESRNPLS